MANTLMNKQHTQSSQVFPENFWLGTHPIKEQQYHLETFTKLMSHCRSWTQYAIIPVLFL